MRRDAHRSSTIIGMSEVTRILAAMERGDAGAANELLPLVYDQLKGEAQRRMAGERPDHTLQATALVHEAYLRLLGDEKIPWQNRAHFFAAAPEAMRRIEHPKLCELGLRGDTTLQVQRAAICHAKVIDESSRS